MTGETDTRIVNMRINNKEFLKGTSDSLRALDTLNKGIDSAGKGKGMQSYGKSVDTVKTKFGALQVAGVTALATITHKAVDAGLRMIKSLTIGPVMEGFREYEKLLTSTQTIMANTGESAKTAGRYLDELNRYSDQTIYNFGQMADNIGKFTAAGVKLPQAVSAIKGLANSAALAGSNTHQLNTAMYQMSQALASGSIKLMDWNSLVNAGMGGKNMQNTLKATALTIDGVGAKMQQAMKSGGSFRDSLRQGWLTADVFAKSMKVMAGQTFGANTAMKNFAKIGISEANAKLLKAGSTADFTSKEVQKLAKFGFSKAQIDSLELGKTVAYTTDQLRKMGYSKEAAKRLSELSQRAIDSATKIKTFSQLMDVVKESIVSGWAGIFKQIFGDLDESIEMWTAVGNVVTGAVDKIMKGAIGMLSVWHNMETVIDGKKMNGFQMFWGAIGNIFKSIGNLLRPFVMLLGALIPNAQNGGTALFNMTEAFYHFTVWLEKVTSGTSLLNPLFEAMGKIIGALVGSVWELVKLFLPLGESILKLVVTVAEMVASFLEMADLDVRIGEFFQKFVDARSAILSPLVNTVKDLADAFTNLLKSGDFSQFGSDIRNAFANLGDFKGLYKKGVAAAKDMIAGIREGLSSGDWQATVSGWVDQFVNFFKNLLGINSPSTVFMEIGTDLVRGLVAGVKGALGMIGDALSWIANELKDLDKFDIATAFSAIFSGAVIVSIMKFMGQISRQIGSFRGILTSVTGTFDQATATLKTMQTGIRARALLDIALAIGVLAVSLWILSKIPEDKIVKGLGAITVMLVLLTGTMAALSKWGGGLMMPVLAASLILMAGALIILAGAMFLLAKVIEVYAAMDWGTFAKGLGMMAITLLAVGAASVILSKMAPMLFIAAAALVVLSVGLAALLGVIIMYSNISWDTLWSGLLKMGAALLILGLAMIPLNAMAPMLLIASAALVVLGIALISLLGAILAFAAISWGDFGKGLAMIAIAILAIGLAGMVAAPGLIALGAAAVLLGAGFLMMGAGLALAGVGLALIAAAGTAAIAVLLVGLEAFLAMLPIMAIQFVAGLRALVTALAEAAPEIVDGLIIIGTELLRGLVDLAPKVAEAAFSIIQAFLDALVENQEMIFDAGFDLIQGFLDKINERMPELIDAGTDIVVKILEGLGNNSEQMTMAAGEFLLDLLRSIRQAVTIYAPQITEEGRKIGWELVKGVALGLIPEPIRTGISDLFNSVTGFFKDLFGINSPSTVFMGYGRDIVNGLAQGIKKAPGAVMGALQDLGGRIIRFIGSLPGKVPGALSKLGGLLKNAFSGPFNNVKTMVTDLVRDFGTGIAKLPGKIGGIVGRMASEAKRLGKSVITGIGQGLRSAGNWVANLASDVKNSINNALGLPRWVGIKFKKGPININSGITIPRFARGTDNFGGGMALVGEAGPELVSMSKGRNAVITNKNLRAFMKSVSLLARIMTRNNAKSKNSPGGKIQYGVGVNFKGKPRQDGVAFAANIVAGLIDGLKGNQDTLNRTMQAVGMEMSESFTDILGIQSPSTVFKQYATWVAQGFIDGLIASTDAVTEAATAMGQAAIRGISRTVTDSQLQLEALRAKARGYTEAADELKKKAEGTKSATTKAKLEKEAGILEKKAQAMQEAIEDQQKLVEKENTAADRADEFEKATLERRAEMRREDAIQAAVEASEAREEALALAKEAELLRKWDKARADAAAKESAAKLAEAQALSDKANMLSKEAYDLSQQVQAEIDAAMAAQLQSVTAVDVSNAQAAFDAYTKMLADAEIAAAGDGTTQEVVFNQYNTSPEAISPAEAYRQGKSLVSIMERKLVPDPT